MQDNERAEEEETYTKVDKRVGKEDEAAREADAESAPEGSAPEEPAPEEPAPEATQPDAPAPQPPEEDASGPEQTLADVGVYGILRFCASLLMQQAWIALGIQAPQGGETKQNLPDAKVAIDTLAVIVEKLAPDLDDAEKQELDGVVANLRVNYVQRAG